MSPVPSPPDTTAPDTAPPHQVDGRRQRREHNRRLALEALLDLYREGNLDPSAAEVAERAGLSPRSLFRYFDDTDDLARAAVEHHLAVAAPLTEVDAGPGDTLDRRVDAVVASRLRLWREVAPGARVVRVRTHRSPVLADALRLNRAALRRQLRHLFTPELDRLDPREAAAALAAADVLCSFEAAELLLEDQRCSRTAAAAALTRALRAVLTPADGTDRTDATPGTGHTGHTGRPHGTEHPARTDPGGHR